MFPGESQFWGMLLLRPGKRLDTLHCATRSPRLSLRSVLIGGMEKSKAGQARACLWFCWRHVDAERESGRASLKVGPHLGRAALAMVGRLKPWVHGSSSSCRTISHRTWNFPTGAQAA
ncbi:hypothetical protein DPEC_G00300980 [Dallia pectoralis]|uniref:Uncharacterized protein n=1 Tax=Dallia pectoralis TaxID=75939 RepID=A0ACC2FGK3_DALPE|nr:hypothetical protein DPEC_G00300980 [Dallia pectoralis]